MTDFDRRDVVHSLTALLVLGAFSKPDTARAGGGAFDQSFRVLVILAILVAVVYITAGNFAFAGKTKTSKMVKDGSGGKPSVAQRLRTARKCGTLKLRGDAIVANLSSKCSAALAEKRSVKVSIPIQGESEVMELTMRRQNQRTAQQIVAAVKAGGKTAGAVYQDKYGLIFNARSAQLG